jgi:hypothetical protein
MVTMNKGISNLTKTREFLLQLISEVTEEEFNTIPEGFNNNIIWNVAHLLATQQAFAYLRSGQKMFIDEHYFIQYRPDTKPAEPLNTIAIDEIKRLLVTTIDQFEIDYNNNLFSNYNSWTTRSGITINNIDDAIQFMPFHEGLHTGCIMSLKRALQTTSMGAADL